MRWDFAPMQSLEFEAGYSRQNNLYAGDTQNTNNDNALVKKTTVKRRTVSIVRTRGDLERRLGQRHYHQQLGAVRAHPQLPRGRAGGRTKACSTAINSPTPIWPT
ncbi:hypothetical protein ACNKHO_03270 [Shigella flexneri]